MISACYYNGLHPSLTSLRPAFSTWFDDNTAWKKWAEAGAFRKSWGCVENTDKRGCVVCYRVGTILIQVLYVLMYRLGVDSDKV